jgi:hypothetical protein
VRFLGHDVIGFTTENPSSTHASAADPGGAPRLSVREKSLYAAGDLADGITNVSLGTFLLFYLTAVCGLPGSLAGAAVAISLMVDAVVDPLIGYISDNTRSRWGRRHPYMFASAIPFAGALGMIYSIPAFESTWALFAYVVAVLIVLRVSFSTFVLPYAAGRRRTVERLHRALGDPDLPELLQHLRERFVRRTRFRCLHEWRGRADHPRRVFTVRLGLCRHRSGQRPGLSQEHACAAPPPAGACGECAAPQSPASPARSSTCFATGRSAFSS